MQTIGTMTVPMIVRISLDKFGYKLYTYNMPKTILKQTKAEKAKETLFAEQIAPLIDQISELCNSNDMPLIVAVQLYINKTNGARVAAQSIETASTVAPLRISSKMLRGEAKVTLESESSFHIELAGEDGEYEESLEEHAEHCEDCKEEMFIKLASGEDISAIRILSDAVSGEESLPILNLTRWRKQNIH
jgi:hypothetical protein